MGLADYFQRNATAASQILTGFNQNIFEERLWEAGVGIGFAEQATTFEGRALLSMVVRLVARLYPTLSFGIGAGAHSLSDELADLARSINPKIEIREGEAKVEIAVGLDAPTFAPVVFHSGSRSWDAYVSTTSPLPVGSSRNPFGAGAAACFACANVFRSTFLESRDNKVDTNLAFSVLDLSAKSTRFDIPLEHIQMENDVVLVGLGAIGNGAAWALSQVPLEGKVHLVDPEAVELSNLQRYVLAKRDDDLLPKVDIAGAVFTGHLAADRHQMSWANFLENLGYCWPRVLVALDSARDRRAVQASLPAWIANAWTQPGDLGISLHTFEGDGACLNCLYLPAEVGSNEDAIIANALAIPERLMQIRELLYYGRGVPPDLLEAIAAKLSVPLEKILVFEGQPLRTLYVEGVCGGAIIPLGQAGAPKQEAHVPLAHQSALAGVLLAGTLVRSALGASYDSTLVTRIDLMRPLGSFLSQPARKDNRGICICHDPDYIATYRRKYS